MLAGQVVPHGGGNFGTSICRIEEQVEMGHPGRERRCAKAGMQERAQSAQEKASRVVWIVVGV